ncbi:response regulator [Bacillus sp. JCM 19034]|uniref:response regulator n=1 Tax=Bacillus sp. JCM 19034 TaxID=1481928 RepID=UPI0007819D6A|nr:response regulator [Bacillus sp. JCM 19034]
MFKAILIDDEKLALERLKALLHRVSNNIDVIGEYQNAKNALEAIQSDTPDIIFLDIRMPEISGIELANLIRDDYPEVFIVFVSGYDQYAMETYEIFALDYLLKPIMPKRLKKTLERLETYYRPHNRLNSPKHKRGISVSCFQEIKFYNEKDEEIPVYWRTKKVLELFAYLLHHRNKFIAKGTLIELLWPDSTLKQGYQQLYTMIYHCRNSLKKANIRDINIKSVTNIDTGYLLEVGNSVSVVMDEWDNMLNSVPALTQTDVPQYKIMFNQYIGDYYGSYYFHWALDELENRRQQWLQIARMLADYYFQQNNMEEAISIYSTVQKKCPYAEESYVALMKLYAKLDQYLAVENQYHKLKAMLRKEYDIEPTEEISKWYKDWEISNQSI